MNLKSVSLTNLKGVTATYALTPLTVITGDNASGKSAIQNAIQIGLQGYHEKLGKQHSSTFQLAGDRNLAMGTTLDFGDGVSKTCCWTPKRDGTVSFKENVFGGVVSADPVLLDYGEYQTMTGKERIAYAFKQLQVDSQKILARLREACGAIEVVPSQNSALEEMKAVLEHQVKSNPNIQLALEGLIAEFESRRKNGNQLAKQSGQALLRMPLMSPAPVDCQQDLEDLQTSERSVAEEAGAIRQKLETIWILSEHHSNICRETEHRGAIEQQIASLSGETSIPGLGGWKSIKEFVDSSETLQAALLKARAAYQAVKVKIQEFQKQQDALIDRLQAIKESPTCPTCGAKKAGWKDTASKEINEELQGVCEKRATQEIELCRLKQEGEALATKVLEAKKLKQQHQATCEAITALTARLAAANEAEKQLAIITNRIAETGDHKVLEERQIAIQKRQQVLTQKRAELFAIQTAFNGNQDMKRRRADTERELIGHQNTAEVAGKFLTTVANVQQDVLNETFGQLLNVANLFCDGILKSPLVYRDGEIGRMQGDTFIAANTVLFSGFEQRLAFMALQVALASTAPFKIVMLDEMGTFGMANKAKVSGRLADLIQRTIIDQAILIDLTPDGYHQNIGSFINIK